MNAASLCSGIGGIDLVCQAFGWDLAWHAEIDPDAATVHRARFDDLPNVGDIKTADWSKVEPVDVLTAGYPCQPFSTAGKRKAHDDPRHLWPAVRDAVAHLRPSVVLLENVAGHVSLGLGQVLRDLAALGFDAEWGVLGSADVGGCHRRNRIWIAATDPRRGTQWQESLGVGGRGDQVVARLDDPAVGGGVDLLPTPRVSGSRTGRSAVERSMSSPSIEQALEIGRGELPREFDSWDNLPQSWQLLPTPRTSDGNGAGAHGTGGPDLRTAIGQLLPTPTARDWKDGAPCANVPENALLGRAVWGDFQAAVDRWATHHGPPPAPTDDRGRLNPAFPEWMLGYPAGWVTDVDTRRFRDRANDLIRSGARGAKEPDTFRSLTRTAQLRLLGNSVQPQAGLVAYRALLARAAHIEGVAA